MEKIIVYIFRIDMEMIIVYIFRMATLFLKTDPLLYGDAFPAFDKPSVVGEMCVTKQRDVLMGRCQAKYLYEKAVGQQCNFDLNIGYDEYENKDVLVNEGLDKLLIWLLKSSEPGLAMNKVLSFDTVFNIIFNCKK